jgi:hypothetical protein
VDNYPQPNAPATRTKHTAMIRALNKNYLSLFFVFNHQKTPSLRNERLLTKAAYPLHHKPTY